MPQIDLGQVVGAQGPQGIQGPQGAQGIQGPAGPAATINGVNALTIEAGSNIDLAQESGTATLSVPTDSTPTAGSTKPIQSGGVAEALNAKPNRNLLDNWYFVGGGTDGKFPVNQRGQTSYNIASSYTIDRWMHGSDSGTIELTDEGLKFTGTENNNLSLAQFLDFSVSEDTLVTLSALYRGQIILDFWGATASPSPVVQNGWGLHTFSYIIPAGTNLSQRLYSPTIKTNLGQISYIAAVKLELGSQQTLAHQDEDGNWVLNEIPNYGEDLAKCQRYCYVLDGSAYNPQFAYDESSNSLIGDIPFPVPMRITPSVSMFPLTLRHTSTGASVVVSAANVFVTNAGLSLIYQMQVSEGGPLVNGDIYAPNSKIIFSADL